MIEPNMQQLFFRQPERCVKLSGVERARPAVCAVSRVILAIATLLPLASALAGPQSVASEPASMPPGSGTLPSERVDGASATGGGSQSSPLPRATESIGDRPRGAKTTDSDADSAQATGADGSQAPAIPTDPRTAALLERVRARWDAKLKRDFAAVYEFEMPAFRAETNADAFARRFGGFAQWHGVDVVKVSYPKDDRAVVDLMLDATIASPFDSGSMRTRTLVREHWTEEGTEWYHKSQPDPGPGYPAIIPSPQPTSTPAPPVPSPPDPVTQESQAQ
jgi:hypothetical protein